MVSMLNELEVNSVSIERAKEYTEIASEVCCQVLSHSITVTPLYRL